MNHQRIRRWEIMACLLFTTQMIGAQVLPPEFLRALGSEDFKVRQQGQAELLTWARLRGDGALDELLKEYHGSGDPEVRERCLAVLKDLVTDRYLSEGPGFLGIEWAFQQTPVAGEKDLMQAVLVTRVKPGTPANTAGLLAGDLILRLDGKEWPADPTPDEFSNQITSRKAGTKAKLEILRDGTLIEVDVTLTRRPTNRELMGFLVPGVDVEAERRAAIDAYFKEWLSGRKPRK